MKSCCLCKIDQGVIPAVSFHNIPKNDEIKLKWFIIIGREVSMHNVVCSQHFKDEDFYHKEFEDGIKRFLKPTAIPSSIDHGSEYVLDENNEEYVEEKPNLSMLNIHLKYNTNTESANIPNETYENFIECNPECIEAASNNALSHTNKHIKQEETFLTDTEDPLHDNLKINKSHHQQITKIIVNTDRLLETTSSCKNSHRDECEKNSSRKKYVGHLKRMDFTSDYSYNMVMEYAKQCKTEQKSLKQRIRRLDKKVNVLKELLKKKVLTNEDIEIINFE